MKQLALIVEGDSDAAAVANVVNRILAESHPEALFVAPEKLALRPGGVPAVSGSRAGDWLKTIGLAARRGTGVLAVFDGDDKFFEGEPFCNVAAARTLAGRAAAAGAGTAFPLAVVILRREFESLLIAAADQLTGYTPGDDDPESRPADPERHPRGAKEWLAKYLAGGYKESAQQLELTRAVKDFAPLRERMSSFRRLERAVAQLVRGELAATPVLPPPVEAA